MSDYFNLELFFPSTGGRSTIGVVASNVPMVIETINMAYAPNNLPEIEKIERLGGVHFSQDDFVFLKGKITIRSDEINEL